MKTNTKVLFKIAFLVVCALSSQFISAQPEYKNDVLNKIKSIKQTWGGFVTIPNVKIVENLAVSGKLDFIWIEAEHSEISIKDVLNLTIVAENENLVPIVRVPANNPDQIKRYLSTGVKGIVVPSIKNKNDAQKAVNAVKYPPLGQRPIGVERGNRYLSKFKEYREVANDIILFAVMIETKEAVENIEKILSVKGIDLLHIGTFDLSSSMGVSMQSNELKNAVAKVEAAAKKKGIPLGGYAATMKKGILKKQKGYKFFTVPGDMELLQNGIKNYFDSKK